jgi:hypothetical protein
MSEFTSVLTGVTGVSWNPAGMCLEFTIPAPPEDICFPGGFCLSYIQKSISEIPDMTDMIMDFLGQLGPAMAPLAPFFNVLDVVLQIFKCIKAIPDCITQLDPSGLIQCVPDLAEKIDKLMGLIPYLSIPKMVRALIRTIAALLRGIATDLQHLERELKKVIDAIEDAADLHDVNLDGILVCSQNHLNDSMSAMAQALKAIGRIILLINIFIGLFGGEEIPCFGSLLEDNIGKGFDKIIELLLAMADMLDNIADMIVDPDWALTLALGEARC